MRVAEGQGAEAVTGKDESMKQIVRTDKAPQPVGPYSQAVVAGDFVYVAGQGPTDPATGRRVEGGVAAETEQVLKNVQAILEAAGCTLRDVVKVNVYLSHSGDFKAMNEVYARFFNEEPPARTTVQASPPVPILVEIDCVAVRPRA
jgi:2-iminobutanoate/2-iminopropanoate deaminase